MHTFKHPKYYKEIRAERKKLQAASSKQQAIDETVPYNDVEEAQASSSKRQAPKPEPSSGSLNNQ